jgi:hypothetical protein
MESSLHSDGGFYSISSKIEDGKAAVALPTRPNYNTVMRDYRIFHEAIMPDEGGVYFLGILLP